MTLNGCQEVLFPRNRLLHIKKFLKRCNHLKNIKKVKIMSKVWIIYNLNR